MVQALGAHEATRVPHQSAFLRDVAIVRGAKKVVEYLVGGSI